MAKWTPGTPEYDRLIAKAPEMYKALEWFMGRTTMGENLLFLNNDIYTKFKKLLAEIDNGSG